MLAIGLVLAMIAAPVILACPFCSAVSRTLGEQMNDFDVVAIASLQTEPTSPDERELPRATFRIIDFLRGEEFFTDTENGKEEGDDSRLDFETIVIGGKNRIGDHYLVMGNGTRHVNWSTPIPVSDRVVDYMKQIDSLPQQGPDRLAFVAGYFEDAEPILAGDAYDEFAKASFPDVIEVADRLDREQLVGHLRDPDVVTARKRLYYTLLGVCGNDEDVAFMEEVIRSGDRDRQSGLDALLAAYLNLTGDDGIPLIKETFLAPPDSDNINVYAAIAALRFHATETDRVSREQILDAFRVVLDRPQIADMVIMDLARLEDWSVIERLVGIFRAADTDETKWVRAPIISYLQACPLPIASQYIDELRQVDPQAVKRAEMLADLEWADDDDDWGDENSGDNEDAVPAPDLEETPADSTEENGDDGATGSSEKESGDDDDGTPHVDWGTADGGTGDALSEGDSGARESVVSLRPPMSDLDGSAEENGHADTARQPESRERASFVSTTGPVPDREMWDPDAAAGVTAGQLVHSARSVPAAAVARPAGPSIVVLFVSAFAICVLLFGLSWSVLNGWFEKLLF